MANQAYYILTAIALSASLSACGGDAGYSYDSCRANAFLYEFIHGHILERHTIICTKAAAPSEPTIPARRYVRYVSEHVEVTYRDDMEPVRVVGAAPQCVLDLYALEIPEKPFRDLDCRTSVMVER